VGGVRKKHKKKPFMQGRVTEKKKIVQRRSEEKKNPAE